MHSVSWESPRFSPPVLKIYGKVKITGMPGGSVGCEGASGKTHKFSVGEDDNKFDPYDCTNPNSGGN